jgi:hypothetical protein
MTTSIYQNPFVFEKRGQAFSNYIGLMIKHFNDKKDEFGLTTRHHIKPRFLTNNVYDHSPWNVVHLLHEVHVEAHDFLLEDMPNEAGAIAAVNRLKGGCQRLAAKERWDNPEYVLKQLESSRSESTKKHYEDNPEKRQKASEAGKKHYEENPERKSKQTTSLKKHYEDNPEKRQRASEKTKKRFEDPNERLKNRQAIKDSEYCKNRPRIKCDYCGETTSVNMHTRWHGDNCIENPESTRYKKKHKIE